MLSVKPITPNLLAQYADKFGNPDFPAPELTLIIILSDLFSRI
jgi:hypothetical protein